MKKVDASGLVCPEPLMMLHSAIRDAKLGECVELIATDASTERDVLKFCQFLGHELLENVDSGGASRFVVRKACK